MEGKKSRAVVAASFLLMVLLLSAQQQQVAAMSKFCRCYQKCYADCRKDRGPGPYPCNFECLQDCVNGMLPPAPMTTPLNCGDICLKRICGVMETGADAEECVAHCTKEMGAFAPGAAKIN